MSDTHPVRGNESGSVTVDGVVVPVRPGQTVAGVLLGMGRTSWRSTRRDGRPRGVFCGIGVCFDCLVVVNGVPDVRACLRTVTDGDVIEAQQGTQLPGLATKTSVDRENYVAGRANSPAASPQPVDAAADSGVVEGKER